MNELKLQLVQSTPRASRKPRRRRRKLGWPNAVGFIAIAAMVAHLIIANLVRWV